MTAHQFPSVTSILNLLDKPAVNTWRVNCVADWLQTDNLRQVAAMAAGMDQADWRKYVNGIPYRAAKKGGKRSATALGSVVHDAVECYQLGVPIAVDSEDEAWPFVQQFMDWCNREQPTFEASEATVIGGSGPSGWFEAPYQLYAGTLDGIWTWQGRRVLIDFNTNREAYDADGKPTGPYPEKVLQMSAYRYADLLLPTKARTESQFRRRWYEISDDELAAAMPMPKCEAAYVIHLTPQSCRPYPVAADEETFSTFLHIRAAYEALRLGTRELIGKPLP